MANSISQAIQMQSEGGGRGPVCDISSFIMLPSDFAVWLPGAFTPAPGKVLTARNSGGSVETRTNECSCIHVSLLLPARNLAQSLLKA